uniref:Uncharacterized protein n=1 Tax=Anguilla anguilla TaxID=7936 RepID=A0A0E9UCN6_ANGAN
MFQMGFFSSACVHRGSSKKLISERSY